MNATRQASRKRLTADARAAVEDCAGMNARLLARLVTRFIEERMTAPGLSLAQFGLMAQIAAASDDTIGGLAGRCDLDQSTLSRSLRALEEAGLVEIAMVEKDLRRRAVWLTEKGAMKLEAAMPLWRAAQRDIAEIIRPEKVKALAASAKKLAS